MALIILSIPFYLIFAILAFSSIIGELDEKTRDKFKYVDRDTQDEALLFLE